MMKDWYVYLLRCRDGSLYTGITNNILRRVIEHSVSSRAAKYTRSRRPIQLTYFERCRTRRTAAQREAQIKRLTKAKKESLIRSVVLIH